MILTILVYIYPVSFGLFNIAFQKICTPKCQFRSTGKQRIRGDEDSFLERYYGRRHVATGKITNPDVNVPHSRSPVVGLPFPILEHQPPDAIHLPAVPLDKVRNGDGPQ